ncbi:unnamed protein product [Darwinula stevensoni]|uniref:Uncharacterized protein n=1 Tax=Darwinula stevensoni TaxID=69355 RepID=A0A7R9AFE7_9CRUS|nr:unnamed protein product [Darwinula stevensoni]CAG0903208.1 unnamed protein product [Darwinula stevensoni]
MREKDELQEHISFKEEQNSNMHGYDLVIPQGPTYHGKIKHNTWKMQQSLEPVMEVAKSKNRMLMEIQPRSPSLEVEWTPVDRPTKTPGQYTESHSEFYFWSIFVTTHGGSGNMNEQFLKNAKPKNLELPDENTSGQRVEQVKVLNQDEKFSHFGLRG